MSAAARFDTEQTGDGTIIRLHSRALDSRFSRRDRRTLEILLTKYSRLILDLSAVATVNGTGLEMIADWIAAADSAGNSLVLAHCSRQVVSLLNIFGLSHVARVAPGVSEPIQCFVDRADFVERADKDRLNADLTGSGS